MADLPVRPRPLDQGREASAQSDRKMMAEPTPEQIAAETLYEAANRRVQVLENRIEIAAELLARSSPATVAETLALAILTGEIVPPLKGLR